MIKLHLMFFSAFLNWSCSGPSGSGSESGSSAPTATTDPNKSTETPTSTPIAKPGSFTITSATPGVGKIIVSWTNSANAASYTVSYGTTSGSYPTTFSTAATSGIAITSLTRNTRYYFMVTAVNETGSTSAQAETTAMSLANWSEQAYLKAANVGSLDNFGGAIAISGDTIVIGAWSEASNQTTITNGATASSNNSLLSAGAAYVFKRSGTNWVQEAYLKPSNIDADDRFGVSVAISGDTIVVGAFTEQSNQTTITNGTTASANNTGGQVGAAYVFKRTGSTWSQEAYLKAPNAFGGYVFGNSVGISNDTIIVGSYGESSSQTTITNGATANSDRSASAGGAAYIFKRTGSTWAQEAYLKASNAGSGDMFGVSVAISGDSVVVGAYNEDSDQTSVTNGAPASSNNNAPNSGAAYVFKRSGTTWVQEAYLKAANSGANDEFGYSVAIYDNSIVVGARGESSNQMSVINGPTANTDDSLPNSGAAYVFERTGTNWSQAAYLKASNTDAADYFGYFVGISGSTVVVGAPKESSYLSSIINGSTSSSDNSSVNAGAAYVYRKVEGAFVQESYLKAPNADAGDYYGSVAIDGNSIAVGAYNESSNQYTITNGTTAPGNNLAAQSGAAYVLINP